MTEKSETLYNEASKTFEEFGDGCELDMLDNLYDLLNFVTDGKFRGFGPLATAKSVR